MRPHDRQRGEERLVVLRPITTRPTHTTWGGTTYALQCSAVKYSSHPMTGHVVAKCNLLQPAAPTPHGWTSRRAPAGRSQSTGQEQRDEGSQRPRRGGGGAPGDEPRSPKGRVRARRRTRRALSRPRRRPGGSNSLVWFGFGFFSFCCLADMGKGDQGASV